jgi:hypothetical protein
MRLELTTAEAAELHQALGSYLSELRMEIADTDSYDYRQGLKARRSVLSSVLAKLAVNDTVPGDLNGARR